MLNNLNENLIIPNNLNSNLIKEFFSEIYKSVRMRLFSKNKISYYILQEILEIPLFCCEKIYNAINQENLPYLKKYQFVNGIYNLYYGNEEELSLFLFNILDFNKKNFITIDDTKLFFINLHSIKHSNKTVNKLNELIDNFFKGKKDLMFNKFIKKCLYYNKDLIYLFKYIIHQNKFFTYKQIEYFQELKLINHAVEEQIINEPINEYKNKISNKLLDYIALDYPDERKKNEFLEENEISKTDEEENNDDDLNELKNFENDISNTMNNLDKEQIIIFTKDKKQERIDLKKNNSSSSSDGYKNLKKSESINVSFHNKLEKFFMSRSEIKEEVKQRALSFQKPNLVTYKNYFNKNKTEQNKNEIILFTFDENNTLEKVKLKIIKNIIFVFEFDVENQEFIYSHFIFLNSTYLEIKGITTLNGIFFYSIHLVSTYGNFRASIELYVETLQLMNQFKEIYNNENNIKEINNDYIMTNKQIGNGKFGICQLCTRTINNTKKLFCAKIINKIQKGLDEDEYKIMMWEKSIFLFLKKFPNQNIAKAYNYYENSEFIYLISEYVNGTDLKGFYEKHLFNNLTIKSDLLISISYQILNALNYIHSYGILHRDIKHTNILINNKNQIKLIDFGLSRILGKNEYTKEPYGSLTFKSPEIIMENYYNEKVDLWSFGVTLFYLIFGRTPFQDESSKLIKERICKENININIPFENYDFELLGNIINECLIKNYNSRPNSFQIIEKYFSDLENQ